ncbi:MAG: hypothetical protein ACRD1N_01555 [Terriglobia bacterium]
MKKPAIVVIALMLASPVFAGRGKPKILNFDVVLGMPIVTVHTSEGKKRFVLDTGSNISTMDVKTEKRLRVRIAGKRFTLRFRPTQTDVFREFKGMLPPTERVDGILGSDFMRHFRHVDFNFKDSSVSFE